VTLLPQMPGAPLLEAEGEYAAFGVCLEMLHLVGSEFSHGFRIRVFGRLSKPWDEDTLIRKYVHWSRHVGVGLSARLTSLYPYVLDSPSTDFAYTYY
jgi:hypothetical protein